MWNIRGKVYDLTLFINKHPGGKNILTACKGSDDLTASFESNHVMCDMKKIEKIMEKYQIGVCTPSSISLKNDGFYRTIQNRVKDKLKNNYKGNFKWAIKSIIQGTLFLMSFIYAFYGNYNIVYRMFFAAFAGHMILQFGFCVMHDGSHSAISKNKYINNFCTDIWNALAFWDYAAAAPYVSIEMNDACKEGGASKDAIFISPHKFVGGPGTPGVLVVKKKLLYIKK